MAKKEGIRKLFDNIAPDYDKLNHILSLNIDKGWRKKAVREIVDKETPLDVLDVACGTGDFTIEIAQKAASGSKVVGIDLSEGMMKIGREKIAAAGVSATMVQGDCEELPYDNGTFDRISVGFGVRNFANKEQSLSEMRRVLREGGVVEVLELSRPTNKIFGPIFRFYFHKVMPIVGGWISGDRAAYKYLPASVDKFPAPERFVQMMREAGLRECRAIRLTLGIAYIYIGVK